jgi:hypothetical protein
MLLVKFNGGISYHVDMLQHNYTSLFRDLILISSQKYLKLNRGLPWRKQHSARRLSFTSKLDLNLNNILIMCRIWSVALYGAETRTLRTVDQKHLDSLKCGAGRMEKISWTDRVRREVSSTQIEVRKEYPT